MATNVRLIGSYLSDLATATASSTATGYDPDNAVTLDRSSVWVAGGTSSVTLTLDCGAAVVGASSAVIANHNGSAWSGTITIRASTDAFAADDDLIATIVTPTTDQDHYITFTPTSDYQWWRLSITTATAAPQVGIFYIGTATTLTYNPWIGFDSDDVYNVERKVAQSGAVIAEQWGRQVTRYGMRWEVVETTAKDQLRDFIRTEGGPLRPFFYVPREDSTTTTQGRAYLVRVVEDSFKAKEIFGGLWSMAVDLQEEV